MRALIGIAAVAAFVAYCFRRGHSLRDNRTEAKDDLRRWEGEGGNVPAVATPSPAPAPRASFPDPASSARH